MEATLGVEGKVPINRGSKLEKENIDFRKYDFPSNFQVIMPGCCMWAILCTV